MRLTAAILLLFAISGFAQQTAPPPLTERMDVTLVNVEVSVLDARGNPVTDLNEQDFEILEDGSPRTISNFAAIKGAGTAAASASKPAVTFASDPDHRRSVVVLVDVRALGEKPRRARAVDALQRFLTEYPDDTNWSIILLRSGMRSMETLLPMTTDRAAIREALTAVRNGVELPSSTAAPIRRIQATGASVADCPPGGCS